MKKKYHRIVAIFLTLVFMPSLLPVNNLFASTNGPKAPEAASFEPVDATDMVNLVTGDFSYVLPLLNVPSPEGGYPLSLAYHAGIAMDQEASWVGLGWNLNPGAINRNINGYPDDYNASLLTEYFYDQGGRQDLYALSIGYSVGASSVGLNFSWGSHQALGGSVSIGYGVGGQGKGSVGGNLSIGSNGVGIGLGVTSAGGGLSLGVDASSNGNMGGSLGFDNNGAGFNVGYSSHSGFNGGVSIVDSKNGGFMDVDFSSSGVGFNFGQKTSRTIGKGDKARTVARKGGVGLNISFANSVAMGDYTTKTSGWMLPLFVPVGPGFFSLTFGKQKFRYYLGKKENNYVFGPLYFSEQLENNTIPISYCCLRGPRGICLRLCQKTISLGESFMDTYEFTLENNEIDDKIDVTKSNLTFPAYDIYNVQAQGLSGNMTAKHWENGNLFGISNRETDQDYKLSYTYDGSDTNLPGHIKFSGNPYFQFDNEINSYLEVKPAKLSAFYNTSNDVYIAATSPNQMYNGGVDINPLDRRITSNYIRYYTNEELLQPNNPEGYLAPSDFLRTESASHSPDGIGAFAITAADGKTYHYSLPVYNHETVTRSFGMIDANPTEDKAYFEKRQLEPYATHWLLTAVTGPDFVDNGDGTANEGDLGYWVNFEYGKWSEAFVWKAPYGKSYLENTENENIKTWIKGRKELYYLDKVVTRTHTAVFVKSERTDAPSPEWEYRSVDHVDGGSDSNNSTKYWSDDGLRFTIPSQNQLKLDKIVLFKNDTFNATKNESGIGPSSTNIVFNNSDKPSETAYYNNYNEVYDQTDDIDESKAIKVITLNYNNNLKSGLGSLTLNNVAFKGRFAHQIMPPYKFYYQNRLDGSYYSYNIEDKDGWGYHKDDNRLWSLNRITTPQGGKIEIDYEMNTFVPVLKSKVRFVQGNGDNQISKVNELYRITSNNNLGIKLNDELDFEYNFRCVTSQLTICKESVNATVIEDEGNNTFIIRLNTPINCGCAGQGPINELSVNYAAEYEINNPISNSGGIRVANITTTDGLDSYRTEYKYGENGDGIGYVSYLPYAPELQEEVPYAQELPAPKVMYEYVTMQAFDTNNNPAGVKTVYRFNVIKEKANDKIKFGDFFEIDENTNTSAASDGGNLIQNYTGEYTIKDNLASVGQLMEVKVYNQENHLLNKMGNHYYGPGDTPNNIGITQESYQTYKMVDFENANEIWNIASASTRITYPNLLKGTTEYRSGFIYQTDYRDINPIVGQAMEIQTANSENQAIRISTIPAYTISEYSGMGSKLNNVNNKNMLTQEAMNKSFIKIGANWELTNAGITTWKLWENDIWRKHKAFVWDGITDEKGLFTSFSGTYDNFNWSSTATNQHSDWKQLSEIVAYNKYSVPLQVKDINDNYLSTKMCDGNSKVMVTANAAYNEMHYSGAEYVKDGLFDGGIDDTGRTGTRAHTGKWSIAVSTAQGFRTNLSGHKAGKYKISVWASKDHYENARVYDGTGLKEFNGEKVYAGDWVLLNHYVDLTASNKTIYVRASSGTVYYDDFRLYPVASSMTAYVYNEWDELSYIIGNNGLSTHFEYELDGNLVRTYQEFPDAGRTPRGFKKASEHYINYKYQY